MARSSISSTGGDGNGGLGFITDGAGFDVTGRNSRGIFFHLLEKYKQTLSLGLRVGQGPSKPWLVDLSTGPRGEVLVRL